jgi:hypothetical protein
MGTLNVYELLDAIRAIRAVCGCCESAANDLLGTIAEKMVERYGREESLRAVYLASDSDLNYDEFVDKVRQYREPIQGGDEAHDWEWVFYALLMITEPVYDEPVYDEEAER